MEANDIPSSEKNESIPIRGDTIGITAYSERFVIGVLMKLLKLGKMEWEELKTFVEGDLCLLWDMTTEYDVAAFLIQQNALEIFCDTLNNHEHYRLTEIIIGIIANICSHEIIAKNIASKEFLKKCVCNYIMCEDSLIVLQVLRYIDSNIYFSSNNLLPWLIFFEEINLCTSVNFILNNSMNAQVLSDLFKLINTICISVSDSAEKIAFKKMFENERFPKALCIGITEIVNQHSDNEVDIEQIYINFLSIITTVIDLEFVDNLLTNVRNDLIAIFSKIVKQSSRDFKESLADIVQYVTSSLIILNSCEIQYIKTLCSLMFSIWSDDVCKSESQFDAVPEGLTNILPQYFVRTLTLFSTEELHDLLINVEKPHLEKLRTKICDMIKNGEMSDYFSNIVEILSD